MEKIQNQKLLGSYLTDRKFRHKQHLKLFSSIRDKFQGEEAMVKSIYELEKYVKSREKKIYVLEQYSKKYKGKVNAL